MEYKLVAIQNKNGSCFSVAICKNVNEQEYNKLVNESVANEQKEELKKAEINFAIASLKNEIDELKKEIYELNETIKVLKGEN